MVDQDFRRQNDSTSQPLLGSTPLGTNMNNGTTSPSDPIPVKKQPKPMPLTLPRDSPPLPTDFTDQNGKSHVPGNPDPDPSLSYSSSEKYNSLNDTKSSK